MPERCCLTNLPTDDLGIAKIQRAVSQSELIEPLGAETKLPKLETLTLLRTRQPLILPTEAGTAAVLVAEALLKPPASQTLDFLLAAEACKVR